MHPRIWTRFDQSHELPLSRRKLLKFEFPIIIRRHLEILEISHYSHVLQAKHQLASGGRLAADFERALHLPEWLKHQYSAFANLLDRGRPKAHVTQRDNQSA